jgi:hypothetical protein
LKLASNFVDWKRAVCYQNRRPIRIWPLFASLDLGVRKAAIGYPSECALPLRLTVTKLEAVDGILAIVPNNQIEVFV